MKKIIGIVVMLISSMAFANVSVYDHAGVLTQAEQSALTADGSRWPFDLHVLTDTFPNPAALNTAVHRCVNGPNVVCIGIDPSHHKTNLHVGTAVGIPSSEFQSIVSAGNSNFRMNDYFGGIEAIASRARDAAHTIINVPNSRNVVPYTAQPQVQVHIDNPVSTGMSTGWWLFLFFMIALVGVVIHYVRRAVKTANKVNSDMNDFRDEAFEMSSHNIETANMREFNEKLKTKATVVKPMMPATTYVAPLAPALPAVQTKVVVQSVPVTQPTQTVVHNHYGTPGYTSGYNNTLTGSVATDILLASELSRPYNSPVVVTPAPVIVEREVVRETSPDAGGSSSSWGNSNDDDAGGRSSSWGNNDSDSNNSNDNSWDNNSSSSDNNSSDWGGSDSNSGGSDSGGGDGGW